MRKILTETIERALLLEKNFKDVDLNKDKNSRKIFEAARNALIAGIVEEVKEEEKDKIKQKAIEEAQEEIKNQKLIHKIKELRTLTIIGIIIAFFIGMAVNQVTGLFVLLGFFRKWYGMLIILTVSIVIVMSTTNYWILKEEKNERNNSK